MNAELPVLDLVLAARRDLTDTIVELTLAAADGSALPSWEPGAHIDLTIAPGLERQYSLCGALNAPTWTVAVLREPDGKGGSIAVHDTLPVGAGLSARVPHSHFTFAASGDETTGSPAVFVAGGVGITPLIPMIERAEATGRPWTLHYAGATRSTMAYAEELTSSYGDRVVLHVGDEGTRMDLDAVVAEAAAAGAAVWCCGPNRMLDAAEAAGLAAGVSVHIEHFTPKELGAHVDAAFEVEAGGRVFEVPADRSILEVAEAEGFLVVSSCQEGTCGTCETTILAGEADHRDSILSASEQAENRVMFICVSRAAAGCPRLELDLF